jgi:uncharacterized Ntn-hydrolase superfamily protein
MLAIFGRYNRMAALGIGVLIVFLLPAIAAATFSIVAVDPVTGEVGGAGASCIAGSKMITDVIEGIGAIHTQSWYNQYNQANAHNLMVAGATPDSIINWLAANDIEGSPELRQYGVVTLIGPGASAAYTGTDCYDWKGHLTGPAYAIQGNILLGPQVLDAIETAFLATTGSLEDRLMAALEAADIPGADTRCLSCNKPAISAFIKVVRPGDGPTPYLYEYVDNTICADDPIPMLRVKFDAWKSLRYADPDSSHVVVVPAYLAAGSSDAAGITVTPRNRLDNPPVEGASVSVYHLGAGTLSAVTDNGDGTFSASLTAGLTPGFDTVWASVDAGGQVVILNEKRVVKYYRWGDANGDGNINVGDAVFIVSYIFRGGPAPVPTDAADANCDTKLNVGDAIYIVNYIFREGPTPNCN